MRLLNLEAMFVLLCLCWVSPIQASMFTPADNQVIAASNSTLVAELSVAEISDLVINSQHVGQTERLQGILKAQLERLYQQSPTSQVGYLYARVLQKEHQFDAAINIANHVLLSAPNHSNSHLLLANIYMIQGKHTLAKRHCTALLGHVSMTTVSTCILDVQSQQGELSQSYQALKKITQNKEMSLATRHVLSEMSYRLNDYQAALFHLDDVDLKRAPVSLIVLWADTQLALNNAAKVLTNLSNLLPQSSNLEDAILLRLAIAEKNLNKLSVKWQTIMKKRIALRELRQDTFHASDLALYYIAVAPNRDKALYWANINWQHAKMSADKQLLTQAKAMQEAIL